MQIDMFEGIFVHMFQTTVFLASLPIAWLVFTLIFLTGLIAMIVYEVIV